MTQLAYTQAMKRNKKLIKAWSKGAIIQRQGVDGCWVDIKNNNPQWLSTSTFRVKPKVEIIKEPIIKTIHFALYDNGTSHVFSDKGIKLNLLNIVTTTFDDQGNLLTVEKVN